MKRVCAWCKKTLGTNDQAPDDLVTHGICEECHLRLESESRTASELLEAYDHPIFVIDENFLLATGNSKACEMVVKTQEAIEGFKGGDLFECTYARLPEGCGETEHCLTCGIRMAVENTASTGMGADRVVTYLDRQTAAGIVRLRFVVSTQKVGRTVLLRIDGVREAEPD